MGRDGGWRRVWVIHWRERGWPGKEVDDGFDDGVDDGVADGVDDRVGWLVEEVKMRRTKKTSRPRVLLIE